MGTGGRRGMTTMMYEIIISLVLVALFAIASIGYITKNANGEQYFSKFYAADLGTSAEVVNAGYGDVTLRYDNINPTLQLRYAFSNGRVEVGKAGGDQTPARAYFGQADAADDSEFTTPSFLVLHKIGGRFSVSDVDVAAGACPAPKSAIPVGDAVVHLKGTEPMQRAFKQALKGTPIAVTDDEKSANIRLQATTVAGENRLSFSATSPDGASYGCHVQRRISALTAAPFAGSTPTQTGKEFTLQITVEKRADVVLTDEQIGKALALALVTYYADAPESATAGTAPSAPSAAQATGGIALLGDSITVGYGPKLKEKCPALAAINAAEGRQTAEMLRTYNGALKGKHKTIVVLGGVNDIASGVPQQRTKDNLKAIADDASKSGTRVIFLTILPWEGYPSWTSDKQQRTTEINAWLKVTYGSDVIDTYQFMGDGATKLNTDYQGTALPDGYLHPSPKGYAAMGSHVAQMLQARGVSCTG